MRVQPDEGGLRRIAALQPGAHAEGGVAVAGHHQRERVAAERRLHFRRDRVVDGEDRLELVGEGGLAPHRDDLDVVAAGAQRLRGPGLEVRAGAAPAADVGAAQVVGDGDQRDAHGARQSGGAGSRFSSASISASSASPTKPWPR